VFQHSRYSQTSSESSWWSLQLCISQLLDNHQQHQNLLAVIVTSHHKFSAQYLCPISPSSVQEELCVIPNHGLHFYTIWFSSALLWLLWGLDWSHDVFRIFVNFLESSWSCHTHIWKSILQRSCAWFCLACVFWGALIFLQFLWIFWGMSHMCHTPSCHMPLQTHTFKKCCQMMPILPIMYKQAQTSTNI